MHTRLREKHLSALGVVQYRRRSLNLVNEPESAQQNAVVSNLSEAAKPSQITPSETTKLNEAIEGKRSSDSISSPMAAALDRQASSERPERKVFEETVTEEKVADGGMANRAPRTDVDQLLEEAESVLSEAAYGFDLLVWRTEKLLVLEFSVGQQELVSSKHQLANNILRAVYSAAGTEVRFAGVELHQYSWPIDAVAADASSAQTWLHALVAGHLQHQNDMPIWVMGEPGLEILFADKGSGIKALIGSQVQHPLLGVELLVSASLEQMLESAAAKAQAWQLLKTLH